MRNCKKYLAAVLAAAMTIGAPAAVMAAGVTPTDYEDPTSATGTISGSGSVEGVVSTDVFKVTVDTANDEDHFYDFILDPQELITATGAAAYAGADFASNTTLYFHNDVSATTPAAHEYTDTSDYITIANKGTMDVDVTVTAEVDDLGDIVLANSGTFAADDDSTSVYLALKDQETTSRVAAISAETGASLAKTLAHSTTDDLWIKDYVNGKYVYAEDPAVAATANYAEYAFALTGACNANGDWSALTEAAPSVSVTWTVVPHVDPVAPSIATLSYENKGEAVSVAFDLGKGSKAAKGIASVKVGTNDVSTDMYKIEGNNLVFKAKYLTTLTETTKFKVEFDNTDKTTVEVTFTK